MGISIETLAAAKKFTSETVLGGGAVVGKNVTISSIVPIDGGNKVTFSYTLDNGTVKTSTMDVMDGIDGLPGKDGKDGLNGKDGQQGADGIGISKIEKIRTVDLVDTYRITFTDSSTFDYEVTNGKDGQGGGTADVPIEKIKVNGELQTPVNKVVDIAVPSIEGLTKDSDLSTVAKSGSYEDLINKPTIPDAYDDTALSGRVDDVETSIGDMSTIKVKTVSDLVSAINTLYDAFMSSITYADKKLTITYRNGGTVDIDMSAIITDTNIGELSNIDDTGVADKQVLSYDAATNKYIPTTIDTAGVLADAKKYTDDEIAKINNADAMAVDEKPIYSDGTITYKKGGVESTITDGDFWFFYTVDDMAYQTIWIDGVEFTTSVDGSVDFKDFVSKTNDLVSTYTGEETDKTKVTTIASLDALYAIISTALGKKVNTTDIVDSLVSDATDKPLSAAQGKALDGKKVDKVDGMALSSNDYTDEEKSLVATIEDKVDKTSIVTALDDTVTDEQVASALLAKTELDKKIDKTSIVTELSDSSTDDEVVGALTTYNELQKLESANKEQFATASGDYITATDSVDGKLVELGVKGNSFQQTYSGKNLLVYPYTDTTNVNSGVTFTDNGDGSITINGTNTTEQWLYFWLFASTTSEESKRENLYGKQLVVSGLKNAVGSIKLESYYKTTDGKEYWVKPTGNDNDYFTITYPSKSEVALMNLAIVIYPNGVVNNVTVKPMIRLATETDSSYEPYVGGVPSPNPSYPQTINSVGGDGSLVVKSENKNILNIPDGSKDSNGITTTALNGRITCSGTSTAKFADVIHNISILFQSNNVYTFSIGKPIDCDISIKLHDSNGTALSDKRILKGSTSITFTAPENVARATFYIAGFESGTAISISNLCIQVEKGDIATLPVPHKETVATIPLSEPLRSIGDIKDEITYQDGKWGVLRRIKEIIAGSPKLINPDGALIGTTYDILVNFEFDAQDSYNAVNKISDMSKHIFRNFQSINIWDKDECGVYISWAGSISARLSSSVCGSTLDEVKAYFQENPLIGQYVLATPVFEPFADQTLPYLSTYDGVTNISNDDALSAEMTVKYPTTDASGVGSRNESRIAELAKDTDDKFDDVNENLVRVDKNTIANLCNSKNGNNIIIGQIKANTIYTLFFEQDSETGFNLKLNISDGVNVSYKEISPTYSKTKVICWFSNTYDGNIFFNGWKGVNQRNFMIVEGKFDEWIDYITPTGNSGRLNVDVANLKNDLSTKIYELAGSELYLCVSGKSCVLTLNGYNLTGSTNFSKLAEYPPYLVARNVVSKEDGVCIFSVDPDGNIGASDLQVASSVTGKMFGEVSWVANI